MDLFRIISAHFLSMKHGSNLFSCYFEFKSTLNYALHLILINRLLCSGRHALISSKFEFCRMQINVNFALKRKQKKRLLIAYILYFHEPSVVMTFILSTFVVTLIWRITHEYRFQIGVTSGRCKCCERRVNCVEKFWIITGNRK